MLGQQNREKNKGGAGSGLTMGQGPSVEEASLESWPLRDAGERLGRSRGGPGACGRGTGAVNGASGRAARPLLDAELRAAPGAELRRARRKGGEANGDGGGAASGSGEGQERRGIPARFGAWLAQCHAGRRAPDPPDRDEARGAMDEQRGLRAAVWRSRARRGGSPRQKARPEGYGTDGSVREQGGGEL